MTPRATRNAAAILALASGATTVVAAAATHPRHSGFLGAEWAASAVTGGRYGLLVSGVTLVVVSRGLSHGKRAAQRVALVASFGAAVGHHLRGVDVLALSAIGALTVVLLVGHRCFRAASDPARTRRGWWILLAGETTVLLYGIGGLYLLDGEFRDATTVRNAVADAIRLLFLLPVNSVPVSRHGAFFVDSVRAASFMVAIVGAAGLVATVVARSHPSPSDRDAVEGLLDRWATIALARFFLADDKSWWFAPDRSAVLAYRVVSGTAVVLGEPVGSHTGCLEAASTFRTFCDGNGWVVGFHQVTEDGKRVLSEVGLRSLKIGESATIPVADFDLATPYNKSLRSALRRLERTGFAVKELPHPIDGPTMTELREVSDAWLASGGHRERAFTVGQFNPDDLEQSVVLALIDPGGSIVAFVNMLPTYRSTTGNFDLMRRTPHSPNGAMDALFVAMIERCRAEGLDGLDLGMAPFSNLEDNSLAGRTLRMLYERGGKAFNFEGLRAFKEKWNPHWESRYLCYEADTDLPRLAAAITRAGELPSRRSRLHRVGDVSRRFPVSMAITVLVAYVMAVTQVDAHLHSQLLRHFGLGWHDLVHVQWWRAVTALFVQSRSGFVWGDLALLAVALFVAERRLRSTGTAAVFLIGGGTAAVTVLLAERLFGAFGEDTSLRAALHRDGGSSAAAWALVAACAATMSRRRSRTFGLVGVFVALASMAVVRRDEAGFEHLVAALCGSVMIVACGPRRFPR